MLLPQLFLLASILVAGVAVAAVVPSPGPGVDVHVTQRATWHSIQNKWELDDPQFRIEETKLLSFTSWARNAATFGFSKPRDVEYRLETAGQVVQSRDESSGLGLPIGGSETLTITFRDVPPGEYVVHVVLYDEDLVELESRYPLQLVEVPDP